VGNAMGVWGGLTPIRCPQPKSWTSLVILGSDNNPQICYCVLRKVFVSL